MLHCNSQLLDLVEGKKEVHLCIYIMLKRACMYHCVCGDQNLCMRFPHEIGEACATWATYQSPHSYLFFHAILCCYVYLVVINVLVQFMWKYYTKWPWYLHWWHFFSGEGTPIVFHWRFYPLVVTPLHKFRICCTEIIFFLHSRRNP